MEAVRTDDGSLTIKHAEHGEAYHSTLGARTEAFELYIERSSIKSHFANHSVTTVLEVGLGLGYNALTTVEAWNSFSNQLNLVSLESDEMILRECVSGKSLWQTEWPKNWRETVQKLRLVNETTYQYEEANLHTKLFWQIFCGNALHFDFSKNIALRSVNFVWHDPFSPTKNPTMWSSDWFKLIRPYCAPGCELLTYSVARSVKDALTDAGWQIERLQGLGAKKHWLRATLPV